MFQLERQEKILEYINNRKKVRTKDLSRMFKTSVVTIRADINELARQGLIIKSHGGAMAIEDRLNLEIPSSSKIQQNSKVKRRIGKLAAEFVEDHDVIIIDSGSTTLEVAKAIKAKDVTVITNDIKVAMTLANNRNISVVVTGGAIEPLVYTLMGPETVDFFSRVKVNKLFLGCDAFDLEWGISNRTLKEVSIKRAMMAASRQVIAVMDSSKIGKQVFAHLCSPFEIDVLVTEKITQKEIALLEKGGVRVAVASEEKKQQADNEAGSA